MEQQQFLRNERLSTIHASLPLAISLHYNKLFSLGFAFLGTYFGSRIWDYVRTEKNARLGDREINQITMRSFSPELFCIFLIVFLRSGAYTCKNVQVSLQRHATLGSAKTNLRPLVPQRVSTITFWSPWKPTITCTQTSLIFAIDNISSSASSVVYRFLSRMCCHCRQIPRRNHARNIGFGV